MAAIWPCLNVLSLYMNFVHKIQPGNLLVSLYMFRLMSNGQKDSDNAQVFT